MGKARVVAETSFEGKGSCGSNVTIRARVYKVPGYKAEYRVVVQGRNDEGFGRVKIARRNKSGIFWAQQEMISLVYGMFGNI